MSSIGDFLVMAALVLVGGTPTLYLLFSIPVVIGYKIYRKIHFGISIMN